MNLKKEIADLRSLVNHHRRSQNEVNTKLKSELEQLKLRETKLSKVSSIVRYLIGRFRDQRAQIDTLMTLLNGRFHSTVKCQCGRQVDFMSPNGESKSPDIIHDSHNEYNDDSDSKSHQSQESTRKKSKRKNNRRKTGEKLDHHSSIEVIHEVHAMRTRTPHITVSRSTYTEDQRSRIGQAVPQCAKWGPLECLSMAGIWHFKLADHLGGNGKWKRIVEKRNIGLYSRFVLLPVEMAGMTVIVELWGLPDAATDEFKLRLFSPVEVKENESIALPLKFSVQLEMKLLHGQNYRSHLHEFQIDKLACYAQPDNFCIPFSNTARENLPDIRLEFS